jgi:hypothetical protein
MIGDVEAGSTLRFAAVARRLGAVARDAGLRAPAFRSPPQLAGVVRTIRRYPQGAVVAVATERRPFDRVAADMVEGVIAANDLTGEVAHQLRLALWDAAADAVFDGRADWREARVAKRQTQAA